MFFNALIRRDLDHRACYPVGPLLQRALYWPSYSLLSSAPEWRTGTALWVPKWTWRLHPKKPIAPLWTHPPRPPARLSSSAGVMVWPRSLGPSLTPPRLSFYQVSTGLRPAARPHGFRLTILYLEMWAQATISTSVCSPIPTLSLSLRSYLRHNIWHQ